MAIADVLTVLRRVGSRHRSLLAALTVGVLVVGSTTAVAVSAQASAEEQARVAAAAADAREQGFIDYYRGALERLHPMGKQLVDDAGSLAASASPLFTSADVSAIESTADAVSASLARTPPQKATSAELEELFGSQWAMISGARVRFGVFVATAATAAKVHLDAAPIADAASRQTVVDTTTALESALKDHSSIAAGFTALNAAVTAVDASQAAAVAAQAAAAVAAARKIGVVPKPGSAAATGSPAPVCASDVLTCVNQIRAYYGIGGLSSNGTLNSASQACADRMASEGSMTHSSPTPGFSRWGENIAYGYGSQASVFNAWMNSSGHRANILKASYTSMGLGYASGNWWCQQFGG